MNRPLKKLDVGTGSASIGYPNPLTYFGGTLMPLPGAGRHWADVQPNYAVTCRESDLQVKAKDYGLTFLLVDMAVAVTDAEFANTFFKPKRSGRLSIVARNRGKGIVLGFD